MLRKSVIALFLLSQTACFVLLPFIEEDQVAKQEIPLSCQISQQEAKVSRVSPVEKALNNLNHSSDAVRASAATELGFIGYGNPTVMTSLKTLTWNDKSKWVRRAAVKSVYKLAGRDAIPTLKHALKDRDPWVVHSAKRALALLK